MKVKLIGIPERYLTIRSQPIEYPYILPSLRIVEVPFQHKSKILFICSPSVISDEINKTFSIHFCRWARWRVYLCQVPLSRRIFSTNVSWIGKLLLSSILITPNLFDSASASLLTESQPTHCLASRYDTGSIQTANYDSDFLPDFRFPLRSKRKKGKSNPWVRPKPLIPSNRLGLSPGIPFT